MDYERGTLMIRQGKGKKDRMIPIGDRALAWVARYRDEVRPELAVAGDNGTLFFSANDGVNGFELWRSDGSAAGTQLIKDINPGSASAFPLYAFHARTNMNGTLFFSADDPAHGSELWKLVEQATQGTSLTASGFPATITAGVAGSFTVTAKNANGTTNTAYLGIVHLTSSDSQAVLPADRDGHGAALAGDQDFTLVNHTGVEIHKFFTSPHSSNDWEEDVLGKSTLGDGESIDVAFASREKAEHWDIRVEDSSGTAITFENLNLKAISEVVLHFKDGKAWADLK